ncbi:MAG TPA: DUF1697 domain-containing protein [Planctomycetota bacterium]|nr:DUF1697 domain-containing protein [Planctomycetota bacterium]
MPKKTPEAYVALLRGVNVGGKNLLPMKDLAAMFEKAGCADVRTYIQSGNVVFRADAAVATRISETISRAIAAKFRIAVPVVVRSANDLRRVAKSHPFLGVDADTSSLHVAFLADEPTADAIAGLDPRRSPPDEFRVLGREIYLRCPNGVGKSKLTNAWFDSKLATTSTARNWNTVTKLLELASG